MRSLSFPMSDVKEGCTVASPRSCSVISRKLFHELSATNLCLESKEYPEKQPNFLQPLDQGLMILMMIMAHSWIAHSMQVPPDILSI